jgi:hypothetical protein
VVFADSLIEVGVDDLLILLIEALSVNSGRGHLENARNRPKNSM